MYASTKSTADVELGPAAAIAAPSSVCCGLVGGADSPGEALPSPTRSSIEGPIDAALATGDLPIVECAVDVLS